MLRVKECFLLVAVCLAAGYSVKAQTTATATTTTADEASVRQVVQRVQEGWNTHDGKAFAAQFAADADYVVVNGMYAKGRDEIDKGHTVLFNSIYKDSRNVATIKSVRFLRKDVAVVHVEWNLEFTAGGQAQKARALNTMILTKDKGKWSIAVFQNTPIQTERR